MWIATKDGLAIATCTERWDWRHMKRATFWEVEFNVSDIPGGIAITHWMPLPHPPETTP